MNISTISNTPTWRVIEKDYDVGVAITRGDETDPEQDVARRLRPADAERIVACVNAHDELVAALRQALAEIEAMNKKNGRTVFTDRSIAAAAATLAKVSA